MNKISLSLLVAAISCGLAAGAACSAAAAPAQQASNDAGGTATERRATRAGGTSRSKSRVPTTRLDLRRSRTLPTTPGAIIKCAHYEDITRPTCSRRRGRRSRHDGGITSPATAARRSPAARTSIACSIAPSAATRTTRPATRARWCSSPTRRARRTLPVVVASHGSRGQAGACAPSMLDDAASDVNGDFKRSGVPARRRRLRRHRARPRRVRELRRRGQPAERLRRRRGRRQEHPRRRARAPQRSSPPRASSQKIVIIGHSQGGHTALSALALVGDVRRPPARSRASRSTRRCGSRSARGRRDPPRAVDVPLRDEPERRGHPLVPLHARRAARRARRRDRRASRPRDGRRIKSFVDNDVLGSESYPTLNALGAAANDLFTSAVRQRHRNVAAGDPVDAATARPTSNRRVHDVDGRASSPTGRTSPARRRRRPILVAGTPTTTRRSPPIARRASSTAYRPTARTTRSATAEPRRPLRLGLRQLRLRAPLDRVEDAGRSGADRAVHACSATTTAASRARATTRARRSRATTSCRR